MKGGVAANIRKLDWVGYRDSDALEKSLVSLAGIKPRQFARLTHSLITVHTELSHLPNVRLVPKES